VGIKTEGTLLAGGMEVSLGQINGLIDEAQKAKDVVRLNCLLEKKAQTVAIFGVADESIKPLVSTTAVSDKGEPQHEFTHVALVAQQLKDLGGQAKDCLGDESSNVGQTKTDVKGGLARDSAGQRPGERSGNRPVVGVGSIDVSAMVPPVAPPPQSPLR
jgi:hypothetical protein